MEYSDYAGLGGVGFYPTYCGAPSYWQADFSVPVDYVSVELQPFESGEFVFGLELFDATDQPLGSMLSSGTMHSNWNGVDPSELVALAVSASSSDVAYARFYGYNTHGVNAVSADNFTFGTSVPDLGGTFTLLTVALLGLLRLRRA